MINSLDQTSDHRTDLRSVHFVPESPGDKTRDILEVGKRLFWNISVTFKSQRAELSRKRPKMRSKVLQEIIETEKSYVNTLNDIVDVSTCNIYTLVTI